MEDKVERKPGPDLSFFPELTKQDRLIAYSAGGGGGGEKPGILRPARLHLQRGINTAVDPFYLHISFKDSR
ncbi:uncharacterized [Tachysurus ichikawai]